MCNKFEVMNGYARPFSEGDDEQCVGSVVTNLITTLELLAGERQTFEVWDDLPAIIDWRRQQYCRLEDGRWLIATDKF